MFKGFMFFTTVSMILLTIELMSIIIFWLTANFDLLQFFKIVLEVEI